MNDDLDNFYKAWCKETKRGGGVLIGRSIKELLITYDVYLKAKYAESRKSKLNKAANKLAQRIMQGLKEAEQIRNGELPALTFEEIFKDK